MKLLAPLTLLGTALLTLQSVAAPNVVASIKPLHSLVAAVMVGVDEPTLIVRGAASPHNYALKPSDAAALETADIVFWTGHGMELFLADALETLAAGATVIELAETPGIELLPVREGGAFEAHMHEGQDHDHDHEHEHEHGEGDMHFWLDPHNAALMVTEIAATLSEADPENAAAYTANAETQVAALATLESELVGTLAPIKDRPFIVFHDAYQYFEARFGLNLAGSITVSPDIAPGVARIDELRAHIAELGALCVFAEPNFQPAIIGAIIEGTEAKSGVLDPEGGALTEGAELYPELLRGLAASLVDCLG
jgi:zinc transport system substrate-binding protein